jgi:tRNA modification GTPase
VTSRGPPSGAPPIAALSTALGPAAIAVIRLSGRGCFELARRALAGLPDLVVPRVLVHALVVSSSRTPLDEVLVAFFPAPASYTGEDVVEIHCHGGVAISKAVEARVLEVGARRARRGEFTERAVSNGKMDLLDAEALAALLMADDGGGLRAALESRELRVPLRGLRSRARSAMAEAQGLADYPIETQAHVAGWRESALALRADVEALLEQGVWEAPLRHGLKVAILGPPNAGKSSLLNALARDSHALVDAVPGTTRDALFTPVLRGGKRVTLIDTAGLREASGLEAQGVARALVVAEQSDVRIWVEDIHAAPVDPPGDLDMDLYVLSKADLSGHPARTPREPAALRLSVQAGTGLTALEAWIDACGERHAGGLSGRQRRELESAAAALVGIEGLPDDLAGDRLMCAEAALARLAGDALTQTEAAEVYAQFCIGK